MTQSRTTTDTKPYSGVWAMTLLIAVLVAASSGCSRGGPEVVPIEGVATHNGEPVPNIRIYFMPTEGRPSWGDTDEKGHFVLEYDPDRKGAKVGTHTVAIVDLGTVVDPTVAMGGGQRPKRSAAIAELASKYDRKKSTLKVEVTKADRDFQLKLE